MKKILKRVIGLTVFVTLLVGVIWRVNDVLCLKGFSAGYSMEAYYNQDPDTVDVVLIGNSHMFANVNPAVLWDEYGMAAYDLGAGLQPLWNTYYYLEEALKYQTPELIVIDVSNSTQTVDYQDSSRVAMNTLGLKTSGTSIANVEASVEYESVRMDYNLKYPVYHTRYAELSENDFRADHGDANYDNYKGYALSCISTTSCTLVPGIEEVTDVTPMTEKNEKYLRMVIERVQDEGIPLLLTINPYSGIMYDEKQIYNHAEQIAAEYGVDFIDFNEYYEEIGFDSMTDFAEGQHLNYYGAEKFTSYLGEYITENYEVSDRRGESGYESWEANSEFYAKKAANIDLTKTTDEEAYLKKLFANWDRYTICISCNGQYYQEQRAYLDVLADIGFDVWNEHFWIIQGGEILYHADKRVSVPNYKVDLGDCTVAVWNRSIYLDNEIGDTVRDGLNILVYDNELGELVDNCGIDAWQSDAVIRENQL